MPCKLTTKKGESRYENDDKLDDYVHRNENAGQPNVKIEKI